MCETEEMELDDRHRACESLGKNKKSMHGEIHIKAQA